MRLDAPIIPLRNGRVPMCLTGLVLAATAVVAQAIPPSYGANIAVAPWVLTPQQHVRITANDTLASGLRWSTFCRAPTSRGESRWHDVVRAYGAGPHARPRMTL